MSRRPAGVTKKASYLFFGPLTKSRGSVRSVPAQPGPVLVGRGLALWSGGSSLASYAGAMQITALAGGVGGAKLLVGLQKALGLRELTAIVNTADDAEIYGVHVSPDVDIVTYWLAGIADRERGWGIRGDTFNVVDGLEALGEQSWFRLGDRDLATCLHRTERLNQGAPLSEVTAAAAERLGVPTRILPMSDDRVRTEITTSDDRTLKFQEYFVRERTEPEVAGVRFLGIEKATPAAGVLRAIEEADRVILCPSNPIVSIGPILGISGVRESLRRHPSVVAVSPIIRGSALKGPADRLLTSLGFRSTASGVAELYRDFCDIFVVDATDSSEIDKVEAMGVSAAAANSLMRDETDSVALARSLLRL
ncbi:MAG: 2-phospho-L-lactate transferase [Actinomycetota bacterium]|nr:2-phospho-L-lactate transferase [Actinomycetota bacterium]